MPPPRVIWIRRAVLMVVVGLVVAVPVTLLARGGGDEEGQGRGGTRLVEPQLSPSVGDKALDLRYSVPKRWEQRERGGVIRLTSPDGRAGMTLSAPGPVGDAEAIFDTAIAVLGENYDRVEVERTFDGKRVGGLESKGAVVGARDREGTELRFLVAVARGKKRAYLVEFFTTAAGGRRGSLLEAQAALSSLRFMG